LTGFCPECRYRECGALRVCRSRSGQVGALLLSTLSPIAIPRHKFCGGCSRTPSLQRTELSKMNSRTIRRFLISVCLGLLALAAPIPAAACDPQYRLGLRQIECVSRPGRTQLIFKDQPANRPTGAEIRSGATHHWLLVRFPQRRRFLASRVGSVYILLPRNTHETTGGLHEKAMLLMMWAVAIPAQAQSWQQLPPSSDSMSFHRWI
jgi:hypothetical protein